MLSAQTTETGNQIYFIRFGLSCFRCFYICVRWLPWSWGASCSRYNLLSSRISSRVINSAGKKFKGKHKSFLWDHWYTCFGLLVTSPLWFKPEWEAFFTLGGGVCVQGMLWIVARHLLGHKARRCTQLLRWYLIWHWHMTFMVLCSQTVVILVNSVESDGVEVWLAQFFHYPRGVQTHQNHNKTPLSAIWGRRVSVRKWDTIPWYHTWEPQVVDTIRKDIFRYTIRAKENRASNRMLQRFH